MIPLFNNVKLDTLELADPQDYIDVYQHPSMLFSISSDHVPKDLAGAQQEMARLHHYYTLGIGKYFGIYSGDRLIGTCGLHSFNQEKQYIETSYEVHPDFRRRGIATSSLKTCIALAKELFHVRFVFAFTLLENLPSHRVAEKAGMQVYSVLHKDIYFNGKWRSRKVYLWDHGSIKE